MVGETEMMWVRWWEMVRYRGSIEVEDGER